MAKDKKELDDDLLTGGKTLSSDADNKKAEKKKQAAAKKAEKNAAKLAAKKEKLLKEIEAAKAAVAAESDTEKKEKEQQKLKALVFDAFFHRVNFFIAFNNGARRLRVLMLQKSHREVRGQRGLAGAALLLRHRDDERHAESLAKPLTP